MSRRQNLDACRSTPGFEEARQLLAEAWIRMDRPQPNAHGGAFQAGGVYWRLANVLKWLESKLPTLEGPKHAAFVIATNGRLVTGTSATTPADEIALEPRGAQMKDHIPLPAPDYTEDVQGFVHDTQRHYYAEETIRAYAERLHAARVKTLPAQLMAGLQAEVDALRHQLQTLAELGDASGDTQILRMGYAAARLEIESLNTQLQAAREEIKRRDAQEAAIGAGGVEPLRRRECLHQIAEPAPIARNAAERDALLQAAIDFIGTLTGMTPPPIEVAPPEVFAPFRSFVDRVQAITMKYSQAAPAAVAGPSDSEIDALVVSIGPTEGIRRDSRDLTMDKLRMLVRRALATWGQVKEAPAAQGDALDAAFEAVRHRLCGMQRYSFVLGDDGVVRRVKDRTGRWIKFDDAHGLFDPVAVDAARSQAKEGGA